MPLAPALALSLWLAAPAAPPAERPEDRWNLADLYPSTAAWSADAAALEGRLPELAACRGHLGDSAARLRACLDLSAELRRRLMRLLVYASALRAEDTGVASSLELSQRGEVLANRFGEAASFVRPEVLALGAERVGRFLSEEPGLVVHRQPLDDILRAAPHTLDTAGEALVASFGLATGAPQAAYTTLSNADLPWPTVTLSDGKSVRLDQAAYTLHRASRNRADRKLVFDTFWGKWKEYERTFGVTFYGALKSDAVYTKVRRYPDTRARALDRFRLPPEVYDTLVRETNANLPTLHRYFRLRGRMLGVKDLRYSDVYPPLVAADLRYPIDESRKIMLASLAPLGDEVLAAVEKGLRERWMDVHPRPRKLSGAHMAGAAYDVHPYLLLNHNDDYESLSTLVHEWGHAIHSHLSNRAQPYPTAGYATFVAEIASTFNEALLLEHMLKAARTDEERLFFLGSALETLRGTFFRQAMFAEFESEVHARVDRGESLTGEALTRIYGDILRRYHGDREGLVKIDDLYTVEWAYIPHFYRAFYVFQYATSIAASAMLADGVMRGEPGARDRYLALLRAGNSDYPYELVKKAGVDLATPAPYRALAARMNRIMDEMETILARQKK
ncbi:MAG: oligoendopeptidase F family protein [Deltaproteobacteria bacterium]|nr:oligoendopeptidase F family protein [Deltaproteobacteria bacterium]